MSGVRKEEAKVNVGSKVTKSGGDYIFEGIIVAKFPKISGVIRYVVENDDGVLHIFSEKQLELK